ncbi:hypothetical protein MYX64_03345 [Nitrospinae bacterium AH_259_B05_G02_I21]|nr:hypothetical protein [Nitrospinae bacterium AH_259_B05_G02_I21]
MTDEEVLQVCELIALWHTEKIWLVSDIDALYRELLGDRNARQRRKVIGKEAL